MQAGATWPVVRVLGGAHGGKTHSWRENMDLLGIGTYAVAGLAEVVADVLFQGRGISSELLGRIWMRPVRALGGIAGGSRSLQGAEERRAGGRVRGVSWGDHSDSRNSPDTFLLLI